MFTLCNHNHTTLLYSKDIYENLILESHILYRIAKEIDFSFVNESCRDLYSQDQGAPVKYLPEIMFRSAIVQYLNDYSDRDMEDAARYHMVVKWFIGLPIESSSYDHSALGDFRARLGEERWKELFFMLLKQIEDAGFAKRSQNIDATHIIANIAIPGTIGLIRQTIKAIMDDDEKCENSSKPEKVCGDTHYGSEENRYHMGLRGITIVASFRQTCNSNDSFSQDMFTIAKTGVTCPAGCRTIISNTNEKTGMKTFYFSKEVCEHCTLIGACTKQDRRTITIGPHHNLIVEAKKYNETQDFKDDMKERAHIEPKHSEMKRNHGMVRARYWGLSKLNIQLIITAITVNVKRFVNVVGSVCYLEKC